MTKKELESSIASKANVSKAVAHEMVNAFIATVKENFEAEEKLVIAGLGTFKRKECPERAARNPRTGETVTLPAHSKLVFKAEKSF